MFMVTLVSLDVWLGDLARDKAVFMPLPTGRGGWRFSRVDPDADIPFTGYRPTLAPPGKQLSPAREALFRYRTTQTGEVEFTPGEPASARILAGVRPCDLKAIHLMDQVNGAGPPDAPYQARRAATSLIAFDCLEPCDEACFCQAVGSLGWRQGADLFVTIDGEEALIEALTGAGEALLSGSGFAPCADPQAFLARAEARRPHPFGRQLAAPVDQLPGRLAGQWDSPVWERHVERCFSCGTCNLVCPTCYCFDVRDDVDLTGPQSGERVRSWDGCMLPGFAEVAGGHNFRPQPAERQRHRVERKFHYLIDRFGDGSFCVGCGRCGRQCTADIDIFDIVDDLVQAGEGVQ